jgi:hypothetical protein
LIGLNFKLWPRFGIRVLPAIIHNYFACFFVGFIFGDIGLNEIIGISSEIFTSGILIGALFITGFTLFALSVNIWGMGIMTAVQKMSLAGSVLFTIFYFEVKVDVFILAGVILGLLAITMLLKKNEKVEALKNYKMKLSDYLIVIGVFMAALFIEIGLMVVEKELSNSSGDPLFLIILFGAAGVWGMVYMLFKNKEIKSLFDLNHVTAGWILGIPNYFSIYALMRAIGTNEVPVSVIIPSINTGTILIAVFTGILIFREKITKTNAWGMIIAIFALFLLTFGA